MIEDNKPYGYKVSMNIPRPKEISLWVSLDFDFNVKKENISKEKQIKYLTELTEHIKQKINEN